MHETLDAFDDRRKAKTEETEKQSTGIEAGMRNFVCKFCLYSV